PLANPSMVVISAPDACAAIMVQDLIARPFKWTTQAPHCPVSHPTCVPVRPSVSRRNSTRSVRSSTSLDTTRPLTLTLIGAIWRLPLFFRYTNTLDHRDLARNDLAQEEQDDGARRRSPRGRGRACPGHLV